MKRVARLIQFTLLALWATVTATAHPLGNFTISHYTRLETSADRLRLRYIVDYAEIAAFQEMQTADSDSDGNFSEAEKSAWLARVVPQWLNGLRLTANGQRLALRLIKQALSLPPGAANMSTLRIECELEAPFAAPLNASSTKFVLNDTNHNNRQGWHEIVLSPAAGITIFDSTAFANGVTDELKAYPEERLIAPLAERQAEWSATIGALPAGAEPLLTRELKPAAQLRARFAGWFTPRQFIPALALLAALLAFAFARRRRPRIFSR
jgi:nickel/cobalt transporter (NicO) family protein